ncbi:hypothetical protein PFHG_05461 [Plasmodium falciparum HB3]|uniref:Uncharacterized protein n=1 Tax=Plasmodium falciparum (isolate HB3) TaxID=137071 RepID=A0A0L7KL11_PLAFX|nr:hypothetical protein PFHG_05461 [Plasmodium falciparum HB3]
MTADFVLKTELKGINKILEEEKQKSQAEVGADNQNNTTIDKLLKHEGEEAGECLKTHKEKCEKKAKPESVARSEDNQPALPDPTVNPDENADDDAEEDEEEDGNEVEEDEPHTQETEQATKDEVTPEPKVEVNPCEIVKTLFSSVENLTKACEQKYGYPQRHWGWKCISDKTATRGGVTAIGGGADPAKASGTNQGSICVPPRRRKLYVGKLQEWATKTEASQESGDKATEGSTSPQTSGTSSQSEKLRNAFIESAAVETFFLWDRYKKLNAKNKGETLGGVGVPGAGPPQLPVTDSDDPQSKLQERDYRDIVVRGVADDKNGGNNIVVNASGSTEEEKEKMKEIQKKIDKILKQSGNNQSRGGLPNSVTTPQTWWDQNAQHIWNAMVCALTYKTDTSSGEKPTQDKDLKEKLFGKDGTSNEPIKYKYTEAKLDKDSGTEAKSNESPSPTSDTPTTLDSFIKRPTYFRYLEEWGQNFCKERTKRLEDIKDNCVDADGNKQYSGDGEDCGKIHEDPTIVPSLEGPKCSKPCSFYRKWIEIKKEEFTKQSGAYDGQKKNCPTQSKATGPNNVGNGFCGKVTTCDTAGEI